MIEEKPTQVALRQENMADSYCCFTFSLEEEARNFKVRYCNNSHEVGKRICESKIIKNGVWYLDFYDGIHLRNGYDAFGTRHLLQGGESFGSYEILVPGTYTITCQGEGLGVLKFDSVFQKDGKLVQLKKTGVQIEDEQISYEISVDEVAERFETRFFNDTGQEVKLTKLCIRRK